MPLATGGMASTPGSAGSAARGRDAGREGASPDADEPRDSGGNADAALPDSGDADSAPLVCPTGYGDCNGDRRDGCETNLADNVDHCGVCATACDQAGTSARECVQGVCKPTCAPEYADCDGKGANGCEVSTSVDPLNCGACGYACSAKNVSRAACVAGACAPTCQPGFADCNGPLQSANDGCEANLGSPTSCGACGHDCQGGQCQGNQCQPVVLASGLRSPVYVTADANYVHYSDETAAAEDWIMRVPTKGGAAPVPIVSYNPVPLTTDGAHVFWGVRGPASTGQASTGKIERLTSGDTLVVDIQSAIDPLDIAVDGKNVFWMDYSQQGVFQSASDRVTTPLRIITSTSVHALSVSGTSLVASADEALYSVPVGGGTVVTLTALDGGALVPNTEWITSDANRVYAWFRDSSANPFKLEALASSSFASAQELVAYPKFDAYPHPMAVYAGAVYFVQDDGIYRVPTSSGNMATKVVGVVAPMSISTIAISGGVLFWVEYSQSAAGNGAVKKLALF